MVSKTTFRMVFQSFSLPHYHVNISTTKRDWATLDL